MYWCFVEENDNSQNRACHNYAHNMMRSTEPNAIFMTEGGDNQVFSLLYFSYVERKRPDVDFFDQKGNVFPRLYGDLMNVHPVDLEIVRDLRDFQLFSTGRPVYLTWPRPKLHLLRLDYFPKKLREIKERYPHLADFLDRRWKLDSVASIERALETMVPVATFNKKMKVGGTLKKQHLKYMGPWYFKRYGLLYKVVPLRYAIVEGLELYQSATPRELIAYVRSVSQISLTLSEFDRYVDELIQEKHVARRQKEIELLKPLPKVLAVETSSYWDHYTMDYTNVPNANHWDFLTREIFMNYHTQQTDFHLQKEKWHKKKINHNASEDHLYHIERANYHFQKAIHWYEIGCQYGYDMGIPHFNYASFLLERGMKKKAVEYFHGAADASKESADPYFRISAIHLQEANEGSVKKEKENLRLALDSLEKAKRRVETRLIKYNQIDQRNRDSQYTEIEQLIRQAHACLEIPRSLIEELEKKTEKGERQAVIDLAQNYARRMDWKKSIATYDRLLASHPNDFEIVMAKYQLLRQYNPLHAVNLLEKAIDRFHIFQDVEEGKRYDLSRVCGQFYLQYAEILLERRQGTSAWQQAKDYFLRAQYHLDNYRKHAMGTLNSPELDGQSLQTRETRKKIIEVERQIRHIRERLRLLTSPTDSRRN